MADRETDTYLNAARRNRRYGQTREGSQKQRVVMTDETAHQQGLPRVRVSSQGPRSALVRESSREQARVKQGSPKRTITRQRMHAVEVCAAIMVLGLVIGLLFFARPSVSNLENRTLTPFPSFSPQAFITGEFFTNLSLWYADTYPLREPMVGAAQSFKNLYGIQPKEAFYGGNRQSDELPIVGDDSSATDDQASSDKLALGGVAQRNKDAEPPDMKQAEAKLEAQITNGIYMTDSACYTLYYFSQDAAEEYCGVVNEAAERLDGIATVYSVILPTNAGVMLDAQLQKDLGGANQEQAIDYFYSRLSDKVIPVETFEPLYEHKDEYLYFRTDHHWTQLGAYYVYESFCKAKGIEPADYANWEEMTFEPFLGAYYSEIGVSGMADYADSVVARIPQGTNDMYYWLDDLVPDSEIPGYVISDLSDADPTALYQAFVCGNQPLSKIENPKVTDGSSCLIIKDSFGNPFTSVLVDSYQTIYTFDFRYTSQDLVSFVKAHNIQDVIIENCVMFAGTYDAAGMIGMIVDGSNAEVAGGGPDVAASSTEATNDSDANTESDTDSEANPDEESESESEA